MLAADAPNPWAGVVFFGLFAGAGLFIAWRLRWQMANGRIHRAGESQQRLGMWLFLLAGLAALVLALRELLRAVF
jgi:hypothetical protein